MLKYYENIRGILLGLFKVTELEHKLYFLLHQNWYGALLYLQEQCPSRKIEHAVRVIKPNIDFSQYSEQEILQGIAALFDKEENCNSFTINQIQSLKFLLATNIYFYDRGEKHTSKNQDTKKRLM